MRIIIVDDEMLARGVVREYLSEHADVEIVAECANGFEAVKAITELSPDLVFLDIQMPKLDGFEVAELAGARRATSSPRRSTSMRSRRLISMRSTICSSLSASSASTRRWRMRAPIWRRGGAGDAAVAKMVREAVARQQAAGPRADTRWRQGPCHHRRQDRCDRRRTIMCRSVRRGNYLKNQRMAELEEQLDGEQFLRIHRSYIVNIACVERIEQATRIAMSRCCAMAARCRSAAAATRKYGRCCSSWPRGARSALLPPAAFNFPF
jgi:two-component system LytT family response regulator